MSNINIKGRYLLIDTEDLLHCIMASPEHREAVILIINSMPAFLKAKYIGEITAIEKILWRIDGDQ